MRLCQVAEDLDGPSPILLTKFKILTLLENGGWRSTKRRDSREIGKAAFRRGLDAALMKSYGYRAIRPIVRAGHKPLFRRNQRPLERPGRQVCRSLDALLNLMRLQNAILVQ